MFFIFTLKHLFYFNATIFQLLIQHQFPDKFQKSQIPIHVNLTIINLKIQVDSECLIYNAHNIC